MALTPRGGRAVGTFAPRDARLGGSQRASLAGGAGHWHRTPTGLPVGTGFKWVPFPPAPRRPRGTREPADQLRATRAKRLADRPQRPFANGSAPQGFPADDPRAQDTAARLLFRPRTRGRARLAGGGRVQPSAKDEARSFRLAHGLEDELLRGIGPVGGLLDVARKKGLLVRHGCRRGIRTAAPCVKLRRELARVSLADAQVAESATSGAAERSCGLDEPWASCSTRGVRPVARCGVCCIDGHRRRAPGARTSARFPRGAAHCHLERALWAAAQFVRLASASDRCPRLDPVPGPGATAACRAKAETQCGQGHCSLHKARRASASAPRLDCTADRRARNRNCEQSRRAAMLHCRASQQAARGPAPARAGQPPVAGSSGSTGTGPGVPRLQPCQVRLRAAPGLPCASECLLRGVQAGSRRGLSRGARGCACTPILLPFRPLRAPQSR